MSLRERTLNFPDFDPEFLRRELCTALLAFVAEELQDVVGRPEVKARIEGVAAFGAGYLVSQGVDRLGFRSSLKT